MESKSPPCPLFIKRGCSPMEEMVDGRSLYLPADRP